MTAAPYVGRLAPSPTGLIHQGIARTSLGAWLDARSIGGRLILRIEDVDTVRTVSGAADAIRRDYEWLGLDWDEGPDIGGPSGPYVQSERAEHYRRALEQLSARGRTFECSCSRKEVLAASAPHGPGDEGPIYPGTCRSGARVRPGRTPAIRFRTEDDDVVEIVDRLRGVVRQNVAKTVGDFILRRSDGLWAYQLAVTVDDLRQGVTTVVRGSDLLSSSPRQSLLRSLFDPTAVPLEFVHLPLVLGAHGARLSKRDGAVPIARMREAGWRPEVVVGRLAHSLDLVEDDRPVRASELLDAWRDARLSTTDAVWPYAE